MDRFTDLHYEGAPNIVSPLPGPKSRRLLQAQERLESNSVKYAREMPLVLESGKGATLKDVDGNLYIDFFSGIGVLNTGHSNPVVLEAAKEQMDKLVHTIEFPSRPRIKMMETLLAVAPGSLKEQGRLLFGGPTGTDAVAGALKLAQYNTKRRSIIAFQGGYHGSHGTGLACSSTLSYKGDYQALLPETHFVPYPYCYRCPFDTVPHRCGLLCVEYLRRLLRDPLSGVPRPAAIIVEPIQGSGGVVVPPDPFLPTLRDITREFSIPLIVDEIQTGFGRTGRMFACEHWHVQPDIMTMAKSIGGGFPLSATLYHESLDTWPAGAHMGTFRGHVVAMAAGTAAIQFLHQEEILEHVTTLEEIWRSRLAALATTTRHLGDVRGKGFLIGLEFVKDKETKLPDVSLVKEIQKRCYQRGLLVWTAGHYGNVIRLLPALTITETLFSKGLDILEAVIHELDR